MVFIYFSNMLVIKGREEESSVSHSWEIIASDEGSGKI